MWFDLFECLILHISDFIGVVVALSFIGLLQWFVGTFFGFGWL